MENDITANPDYQLIMSFLKSIRPGDMSDEAATQLKMIGERIQSGGSLSDQEREMFQSVMGAMPERTNGKAQGDSRRIVKANGSPI
jgi:hypothetical protein